MQYRHIFATAIAVFGTLGSSFAAPQSTSMVNAEQIRNYLKIEKGRPALVAFMDFQCPSCRKNWPKIKAALDRHPGTKFYSVDFPLTELHKNAFNAAVAYEIGRDKPSTYGDLLSDKQSLAPADLNAYLKAHHLPAVVGSDKAAKYEAKVNDQLRLSKSLHINKTPTVFLVDEKGSLTEVKDFAKLDDRLR